MDFVSFQTRRIRRRRCWHRRRRRRWLWSRHPLKIRGPGIDWPGKTGQGDSGRDLAHGLLHAKIRTRVPNAKRSLPFHRGGKKGNFDYRVMQRSIVVFLSSRPSLRPTRATTTPAWSWMSTFTASWKSIFRRPTHSPWLPTWHRISGVQFGYQWMATSKYT